MQSQISLLIKSNIAENPFSLDTLILKTKELFNKEGVPGFLALLLSLLDEKVCANWKAMLDKALREIQEIDKRRKHYCCSEPCYHKHEKVDKKIFTSVGKITFQWSRMRCQNCSKTFIPLRSFFSLDPYQNKSNELEKIVVEVVSEQSYRRSSSHLKTIGSIPVPRNNLHRWVMDSDCDVIDPSNKSVETMIGDGTCYKQDPKTHKDNSNRGEVRIVVGVKKDGTVVPYGAWTDKTWGRIGQQIKNANHKNKRLKFKPVANLLVSDGEEKLISGLSKVAANTQRCQWHITHDLPSSLRYQDGESLEETRRTQKELASIINISIPGKDYEQVTMEDRLTLSKDIWEAEKKLDELCEHFKSKGYKKAYTYLSNAKGQIFNYLRLWMKTGIVAPKVSSMIERMMREIGRRIKKIGHGWSPEGAAKMTRIIIKRITSAKEWDEYWKNKLKIDESVEFKFLGAKLA